MLRLRIKNKVQFLWTFSGSDHPIEVSVVSGSLIERRVKGWESHIEGRSSNEVPGSPGYFGVGNPGSGSLLYFFLSSRFPIYGGTTQSGGIL